MDLYLNIKCYFLAPPVATPGWNLDGPTAGPVQWVYASNGQIPSNALPGGFDANNEQLYVARAEHNGALIPGKLVPSHGVAYVAWGGVENPKENYEVRIFFYRFQHVDCCVTNNHIYDYIFHIVVYFLLSFHKYISLYL